MTIDALWAGSVRSTRRAWIMVALLTVCYVFSLIDRLVINLLVDPIKADLGLSDLQIALIQGPAFAVLYATAGAPLGRLADVVSRRGLASIAIGFWSVCTAFTGMAGSFATLALARVGVGVGEAALTPTAYSLFADSFDRARLGRAIAVYTAGGALGSGLALLGGGLIYALFESAALGIAPWRLTLVAVGLPGLLLAVLILMLVTEPARRDGDARIPVRHVLRHVLAGSGFYGWTFLSYAALATLLYAFMAWAPSYLVRGFTLTPGQAGIYFGGGMLVAGVAGPMLAGALADRFVGRFGACAPLRVMRIGFVCAAASVLILPLGVDAVGAAMLLGLIGFFATGMLGLPPVALQLATPGNMRGLVSGINLMIGNLIGLGLGPVTVALLSSRMGVGLGAALAIVVCASALVGVVATVLVRAPNGIDADGVAR